MDAVFANMLRPFLKFAGDEELTESSRLRDLGLDSAQAIELLFAIEDTFGLVMPDEDLKDVTFETAGRLWAAVERSRDAAGGGTA